jgi:hypothetical protein
MGQTPIAKPKSERTDLAPLMKNVPSLDEIKFAPMPPETETQVVGLASVTDETVREPAVARAGHASVADEIVQDPAAVPNAKTLPSTVDSHQRSQPGPTPQACPPNARNAGGLGFGLLPWLRAPGRHQGVGQPLLQESWRYRPFGIGWFMGAMQGSTLMDDWTGAEAGYFAGYRLGWDYDNYWGCEFRYGFASLPQWDSAEAKAAQEAVDDANRLPADDPWRQRYNHRRDADVDVCDVSFLYYPWGDAAWRPYFLLGLGGTQVSFQDRLAVNHSQWAVAMPLGIGLKYRYNSRIALRFELLDDIAFCHDEVETLNDVSFTAGVEVRFGGTRKAYWPWNPGRHYW